MEIALIVALLLVFCLIAFMPVVIRRPKEVAELEKENGWLKEVIHNRDDEIDDLREELARK
jgi:hypothetical protein